MSKTSPSRAVAIKTFTQIFKILKANGEGMRRRELYAKLDEQLDFTDWENTILEKSNRKRWEQITGYYTIPLTKAGYFLINNGLWTVTPEGETAIKKGTAQMIESAIELYRKWDKGRPKELTSLENITEEEEIQDEAIAKLNIADYKEKAEDEIREFIRSKNPYEFQNCVAALLNAMGYFIPFDATPGKDGGIDILAYNDPLGTKPPRIVVQVKHKPESSIPSYDIQKLLGTMRRESDVGIFVTSGEFSGPSKSEARQSHKHVELIDFTRFIELWIQYYDKMNDEQKNLLPLQPIYFLRGSEG